MSAFVVDPKTINGIVGYLRATNDGDPWPQVLLQKIEFDIASTEQVADLGQAMYNANVNAVGQRYPNDTLTSCPGTHENGELAVYRYKLMTPNRFQALKSLACWLYQCSEGNVPESKLFQTLLAVRHHWAQQIIDSLPEYDAAGWG